jgi:adenosine/AMP kinase
MRIIRYSINNNNAAKEFQEVTMVVSGSTNIIDKIISNTKYVN